LQKLRQAKIWRALCCKLFSGSLSLRLKSKPDYRLRTPALELARACNVMHYKQNIHHTTRHNGLIHPAPDPTMDMDDTVARHL
jgi:hypothetical protein